MFGSEFILNKPNGESEYLSFQRFCKRLSVFGNKIKEDPAFLSWCKANGIPRPVEEVEIDGKKVNSVNANHICAYLIANGFELDKL